MKSSATMMAAMALVLLATMAVGCGDKYAGPDIAWGPDPDPSATATDISGQWLYNDQFGAGFRLVLKPDGTFIEQILGADGNVSGQATGTWKLDGANLTFTGWRGFTKPDATPTFWVFKNEKDNVFGIFGGEGQRGVDRWYAMRRPVADEGAAQ